MSSSAASKWLEIATKTRTKRWKNKIMHECVWTCITSWLADVAISTHRAGLRVALQKPLWERPEILDRQADKLDFWKSKDPFFSFFWSYIHQSPRVYVTMLTSGRYNKIPTLFLVETLGTCQSSEKVIWLHIFWYFLSWCFNDNKSCWTFCSKFFKSRDSASSRSSVLREAHRRTRDHTISRWGLNMYTVMIHVIQDILVLSYLIFATQWVQG